MEPAVEGQPHGRVGDDRVNLALGTSRVYEAATELSEPPTAGVGLNMTAGPRWNIAVEGVGMGWSSADSVMSSS